MLLKLNHLVIEYKFYAVVEESRRFMEYVKEDPTFGYMKEGKIKPGSNLSLKFISYDFTSIMSDIIIFKKNKYRETRVYQIKNSVDDKFRSGVIERKREYISIYWNA